MVGAIAKDDERTINLERKKGQCEAMHCSEAGRGDGLGAPVARAVMESTPAVRRSGASVVIGPCGFSVGRGQGTCGTGRAGAGQWARAC